MTVHFGSKDRPVFDAQQLLHGLDDRPVSPFWAVHFYPDSKSTLIIFLAAALGEKLICFSQSLGTLDVLEKFIKEDKNLPQEEPWSRRI